VKKTLRILEDPPNRRSQVLRRFNEHGEKGCLHKSVTLKKAVVLPPFSDRFFLHSFMSFSLIVLSETRYTFIEVGCGIGSSLFEKGGIRFRHCMVLPDIFKRSSPEDSINKEL
jgi:hypothetical protein